MGLFQDDFYSTRPRRKGSVPGRELGIERRTVVILVISSLIFGSMFTLLLSTFFQSDSAPTASSGGIPGNGQSTTQLVDAVQMVQPTVVSVISMSKDEDKVQGVGMGSGVIFQKDATRALVVTNNHVIEAGNSFEIVLADGTRRKGEIVGQDNYTDLAVLSMDPSGIHAVAEFGDSDKLKPGETAIAIGNPLGLSFSHTITAGIISSTLQTIPVYLGSNGDVQWEMEVIQTDAPINQGNSGGALVNLNGQVIGINSMKISDAGVEGLGFAIPANSVKPILEALIRDHKIKRPKMGIYSEDVQTFSSGLEILKLPEGVRTGIIVTDVAEPAEAAGLKTRDVIVELDGTKVDNTMHLRKYLFNHKKIGDKLNVTYYRGGMKEELTMTLGELD